MYKTVKKNFTNLHKCTFNPTQDGGQEGLPTSLSTATSQNFLTYNLNPFVTLT